MPSPRAAAAWAAGAHLHDIRQGLRTFSTSFFQAPGRLNLLESGGVRLVIDYCHNVDGMRQLADFVQRMMTEPDLAKGRPPRSSCPDEGRRGRRRAPRAGDRRDRDPRRPARPGPARLRGDRRDRLRRADHPRGQEPPPGVGASRAGHVPRAPAGRADGTGRTTKVDEVLEEMAAVRLALRRAAPGDFIVMCVDDAVGVYREAMAAGRGLAKRRRSPTPASSRSPRASGRRCPAPPARVALPPRVAPPRERQSRCGSCSTGKAHRPAARVLAATNRPIPTGPRARSIPGLEPFHWPERGSG